jgi:hypothetical protein
VKALAVEFIRSQANANDEPVCFKEIYRNIDYTLKGDCEDNQPDTKVQGAIRADQYRLEPYIPRHMVSTASVPIDHLPSSSSGKLHKKRLQEIRASFSAEQLAELRGSSESLRQALTTVVPSQSYFEWHDACIFLLLYVLLVKPRL